MKRQAMGVEVLVKFGVMMMMMVGSDGRAMSCRQT